MSNSTNLIQSPNITAVCMNHSIKKEPPIKILIFMRKKGILAPIFLESLSFLQISLNE